MKELTIEEKAKAYDNIIEKANKMHSENCEACQMCIEELIPELKENEDERIRKGIISFIKSSTAITPKSWITWLEKQGKPIDKIVKRAMTEKQRVLLTETNGDANIDWDTRSLKDAITLLKNGLNYLQEIEVKKQTMPSSRFGGCSEYIPTRFDKEKQGKQVEQNLPSAPRFRLHGDGRARRSLPAPQDEESPAPWPAIPPRHQVEAQGRTMAAAPLAQTAWQMYGGRRWHHLQGETDRVNFEGESPNS